MTLRQALHRAPGFLREELWDPSFRRQRQSKSWSFGLVSSALGVLQFFVMTAEGFVRDQLLLRATALSYFTVLSLIPIIAIVVAIAGAIGIDNSNVSRTRGPRSITSPSW